MIIVDKLNSILQAMVSDADCALESYQYNNLGKSNVKLDRNYPSPTALFVQVTDFVLDLTRISKREKVNVLISFLQKEDKLDAEATAQDNIIDDMTDLAIDFIQRVRADKSIRILDDEIKIKSVFLRSDSNRTGVTVELTITETQGSCI